MTGPFDRVSKRDRRRAMVGLVAAELAQLAVFAALERRMKRTGGPGIIPFELAGTPEKARRIMDTWGTEGRSAARRSLALDFVFPPTYASVHALACTSLADALDARGRTTLAVAGPPLAWAQLAAAGFDYVENSSLLLILAGRDGRLPAVARRAARAKFALLYAAWGYVLGGAVVAAVSPRPSRRRRLRSLRAGA